MTKPNAERIASYRQRKKSAGLVELRNRFVKPEWIPAIDEFIKSLENNMKEQRGIHTSRAEEKIQLNTIVFDAFTKAMKAGIENGADINTLSRHDFIIACELNDTQDPIMLIAYDELKKKQK